MSASKPAPLPCMKGFLILELPLWAGSSGCLPNIEAHLRKYCAPARCMYMATPQPDGAHFSAAEHRGAGGGNTQTYAGFFEIFV